MHKLGNFFYNILIFAFILNHSQRFCRIEAHNSCNGIATAHISIRNKPLQFIKRRYIPWQKGSVVVIKPIANQSINVRRTTQPANISNKLHMTGHKQFPIYISIICRLHTRTVTKQQRFFLIEYEQCENTCQFIK